MIKINISASKPAALLVKRLPVLGLGVIVALLLLFQSIRADYVSTGLMLNGYFMEPADIDRDKNFYQSEFLYLNYNRGPLTLNSSFRYSDVSDTRYNRLERNYQLGVNNIEYKPSAYPLEIWAGRNFISIPGRNIFLDGASAKYTHAWVALELMGGAPALSAYDKDLIGFDEDKIIGVGKVSFTPLSNAQIQFDVAKQINHDTGSAGVDALVRIKRSLMLLANAVYDFENRELKEASGGIKQVFRRAGEVTLFAGTENFLLDSHYVYESLILTDYQYIKLDYLLPLARKWTLNMGVGGHNIDDGGGLLAEGGIFAYGANLQGALRVGADIYDYRWSLGYETQMWDMLLFEAHTGYYAFDSDNDLGMQDVFNFSAGPGLQLKRSLRLKALYEFVQDPAFSADHRLLLTLRYSLFKGLGK